MARTPRTRTRSRLISGACDVLFYGSYLTTQTQSYTEVDSCQDWYGRPVIPSSLSSTQNYGKIVVNGAVTSTAGGGILSYIYNDWPISLGDGGLDTSPLSAPAGWTLDLVAGTNPNRPVIVPLTLLQDLVDIPRQIRDLGKLITKPRSAMSAKELANHYLGAQFGWLPLFEDVNKLLNLQASILKKNEELHRLYNESKGLRRRLRFGDDHQNAVGTDVNALYGSNNYVYFPYDITVDRKSWATIRWKPVVVPGYHPSEKQIARQARQIASGLTLNGTLRGAWDLLPWSWIIDWFTNVSKYAFAYANTVPVSYSDMCFMSEVRRTCVPKPVWGIGVSNMSLATSEVFTQTYKTRAVSSTVSAGFNMPYLDMFRLSILGALFTQRTLR